MAKVKGGSVSKYFFWIVVGLLIVGLAGFGATNFGGSLQAVGSVGQTEITLNRYARALDNEIRATSARFQRNLSMEEAQQFGIPARVLSTLLGAAALQDEAARIGLSVGDGEVARRIRQSPEFQGLGGGFDQTIYDFALEQQGMTARRFEEELRRDAAAGILQAGLTAGLDMPRTFQDTVIGYLGETRSFAWIALEEADLARPVAEASESELLAFYEANPDLFMLPPTKTITYAWLKPEAMLEEVTIDAADIRALYDQRAEEYNRPERRLVERLIFEDIAAAEAAARAIEAGETTFEALVAGRGLALEDVDLGDVTADELDEAADAVFALSETGIAGPAPTPLGPALFRVNAILAEQVTEFDEVREELRAEFAMDSARRAVAGRIEEFDDLLAGGAALEELAAETPMELGSIDWFAGYDDGIAAYEAFAAAAAEVGTGDFPEIALLDDGGIFALRLDAETEARPEPFDTARDRVAQARHDAEVERLLLEQAATLKAQLDNGAPLSSLGYITNVETRLSRGTFIEGAGRDLSTAVFELEPGGSAVVADGPRVLIAQLSAIHAADLANADLAALGERVSADAEQGLAQDILEAFVRAVQSDVGINVNQQALGAVHTQMP